MSTDTYSIQVAVDSTSAVTATRNLTAMEQATGRSERALSGLGSMAKIAGSALAGISIVSFAKDILKINMEFESLRTSLETVTGSAKNAKIAFEGINTFAAKTPYSVKEITEAFIKMKALGLSPTEKALTSFGNTASAMGKSLNQMVEAVANATTGEFENLKAFGIKASKQGDDIKFTFKGVETKVKDSSTAITAYLQKLGDIDFAGGMERQGQTMKGTLSSLSDAWDNFIDHILSDKSGGAISRWVVSATGALGKFDVWLNGATTSIGKLQELQQEQNRLQSSINAHNQNGVIGSLVDDLSGFDASGKQNKLAKNIEEQKRLRKELEIEQKALVDITKAAPVSKIDAPDKKASTEAKHAQVQATKELALAEKDYNEQLNAQVALAENAGKLFAAQQQTKLVGIEAEKQSIMDKAAIEYEHAVSYEEKSRILNESQNATNALLAKEKEIRDAMTNQSAETIDAKIASAQAELDNAGQYNLTLAEQLRLKTEIAGLQTDKAILGETASQSDIKAKSDAEQKANDDRLAAIKAIDDAQTAANTASTAQMAILTANLDAAKEAATGLADAFGSVGGAVGGLGVALASYEKSQAAITDGLQNQLFEIQKLNDGKGDQAKADKATSTASQKQSQLQVKSYGDMAAAAQGFFKKGTAGYNALGVATKVFRAFEMAQSAMSMVRMIADNGAKVGAYITGLFTSKAANAASVAPNVAADGIKATAAGTAAVASASAAPFPIGFATGAAMLAFMLAIGVAMSGSGSSAPTMTGADYQKQQSEKYNETVGGTVLGNSEASKSIVNALDIISTNSTADLDYSKGMAESLQKLTHSIDNVTGSVAQQMNFGRNGVDLTGSSKTTGVFGSAGGGIGGFAIGTAISNLVMPFLGLILGAFTTVTKITKQFAGSGFQFINELYSNVVKNSTTSVQKYVQILVTETKSSFFGLSKSSKQWITTAYKPIAERVKEAFTDTILGIGNSIIQVADLLGERTTYLTNQLNNFNIEIGRIPMERTDYKGKGSLQRNTENAQINEDRLSAAFQKLSDQMAMLSPQFLESQRIQEGYYETLIRVSVAIATANSKLRAMGIASLVEYSDIADKRGDIEKQMIVQSLQLASSYTDVNDILGKLPGTADDIIDAFNGLNSIKFGLAAIGASSVMLTQDMINVAGGISSLDSTLTSYIDNYLTKTEQSAYHTGLLTDKFTQLGLILPMMGANADDAKTSFRSLLETLAKDTTDAGRDIYIRVLGMASEFADAATESADLLSGELKKAADLLTSTLNTATTELNNAYKALITMRDKFAGIATSLQSYLGELNNTASDYDNAKALFLKTSALAKDGNEKALQDMTSVSKAFLTASKTRSDDATKAIQQTVSTAETALQNAYKSLETLRDKFKGLSQSLRDYKTEITGAGTQQGSPESVYKSTKKAFEDANILAATGNAQGIADLPNAAKAFLDASLKYNATGAMYQTDYQSVLSALDKAIGASDSQVDILTKQLTAAENADKSLASIDGTILSIDEAIKQYQAALKDQSAIDTTRYEEDKSLVAQNVKDALAKTNEQIDIMNLQLTQAETANSNLILLQSKTDTVSSSILTMSGAISSYVAAQVQAAQAAAAAQAAQAAAAAQAAQVQTAAVQVAQTNLTTAQAAADALPIKMANAETNRAYENETYIKTAKWLIETGAIPSDFANVLFYDYGSAEQKQLMPNIPAYANGGMASGLSLVGEKGAELVNFNSPANVTSHSQTTGLFDSIGEAMNDQNIILEDQVTELKALVNLQSNANMVLINEMKGMREELSTISRKAKLEAAA